jgi:Sulfotransferase family
MLGQHPQMYGLPETHLFRAETVKERQEQCEYAVFNMTHGLLRAIAQIIFGEQTEANVRQAERWLKRRSHYTTGMILELLAQQVYPAMLVDKSPGTSRRMEFLERAYSMFPQARFLHLLRHPRGQCQSLANMIARGAQRLPSQHRWHEWIAAIDPQISWYNINMNICEFLETVPEEQQFWVRGEDVLREPNRMLRQIARWLGLRTDDAAIEEMKHPERSPFACFGPPNARNGNDPGFLEDPVLRPDTAEPLSLEGPLPWRNDRRGFLPRVKWLAQQFGYE